MKYSGIVSACVLTFATAYSVAAGPVAPAEFKIEVRLVQHEHGRDGVAFRCLEGCDWALKVLACPEEMQGCRTVLTGRRYGNLSEEEVAQIYGPRVESGGACLGAVLELLGDAKAHRSLRWEHSGVEAGAGISEAREGSPAAAAGFRTGDFLISFNSVPMRQPSDVLAALQQTVAGQKFDATLYRQGALLQVSGRLGATIPGKGCQRTE